ncbi:MAG: tetratricopeptide repeat protein [Alphaproteobacteria bacterium]|nr:tetratricopeptide repeat protein [Alphaproteobacteria bacterium]
MRQNRTDALKRFGMSPDALMPEVRGLNEDGRHSEALDLSDYILGSDPRHADALYSRAEALAGMGLVDEARGTCERLLEISPGHEDALSLLGSIRSR